MPRRELSCFICRELLYEFVSDSIDTRRGEAVAHHLHDCHDCKHEHEGLKGAMTYTKRLSAIEIRPEYFTEIASPTSVNRLIVRRMGWKYWPDPIKWTVESLAFACVVALVVGVLGQQIYKTRDKTDVAAVEKDTQTIDVAQLADQTPAEFGEDEFTDHDNDVEISQVAGSNQPLEKRVATPEPDVKVVQAEAEIEQNKQVSVQTAQSASENTLTRAQNGFLYRTTFKVQNLETSTAELVAKVEALGGKKAGEVPLGWKRSNGSYFHFSMPEANYPQLSEFLRKFGAPSIVKEKNPRVMPEGSIRMILEVEGNPSNTTSIEPTSEIHEEAAPQIQPAQPIAPPADTTPEPATNEHQE